MTPEALIRAMEATWPAADKADFGPVVLRDGQGGGKRVSAASAGQDWTAGDLDRAEKLMRDRGQAPLFQLLPDQTALDAELAARGYALVDPVLGYAARVATLAKPLAPMTVFSHWPPLQIAREIWAEAGLGPARVAVMERAGGAKTVVLARQGDRPAGVLFAAKSGTSAMVHALEVRPEARRKGVAVRLLQAAAIWASDEGAEELGLVVTVANTPARALYAKLGMAEVAGYHYRELQE
jgi:GNAT superfamily N-acetyltransferase